MHTNDLGTFIGNGGHNLEEVVEMTCLDQELAMGVAEEWRLNVKKPRQSFPRHRRATTVPGPPFSWLPRFCSPLIMLGQHMWLKGSTSSGDRLKVVVTAWWEKGKHKIGMEEEDEVAEGLWATWQPLSGHFKTFQNYKSFPKSFGNLRVTSYFKLPFQFGPQKFTFLPQNFWKISN